MPKAKTKKTGRKIDISKRRGLFSPRISELKTVCTKEKTIDAKEFDPFTISTAILGCNSAILTIENLDLIPEEWVKDAKRKGKKIDQIEIIRHSPPLNVQLYRSPIKTFYHLLAKIEEDPNIYPWFSIHPNKETWPLEFRLIDLFEAELIRDIANSIGEDIEVKGSGNEICGKIPSRSQELLRIYRRYGIDEVFEEDLEYQKTYISSIKRKDEDFSDWYNIKPSCTCEYSKYSHTHYRHSLCPHIILTLKEAEKQGWIKIFPNLTQYALDWYYNLRFRVLKRTKHGRKPFTRTESDLFIQYFIKNCGKEKLFIF